MKKVLITIIPFLSGMFLVFALDFPKDGFYIKNMSQSTYLIFIVNLIICLIILYSKDIIADIIYAYNLFFMGMVSYIMIFILNNRIYYHAPIEIFTIVYTYVYARCKEKNKQVFIIMVMILLSAIVEGVLYYV
ncbi:MAG: hypothetical protein PT934_02920 [Peptoniphilaceae bacterium]|uniref:hypothetical protein n=1 Tax=Parvimonas sp. TaxID=1944660 RepID=UPI0025DA248F|nr:hypothetical protein [Parvimonas sp.]MCI5996898.1 hypothetical protein [Parvimonas sp.]MDD7764704.1 hypothetical protein [Peptoniphilaceae bacterium]MDY3051447.1 hypothetical protein [Parvimonas sp.]